MSSTTTTEFYGLSQYIGTDKPDFADNNEAFRRVDADLHGVVQDSEGFSSDIAALQEAQNALNTEVTDLSSDLNTEKAKITALQNKETLQDAAIADVRADALDMIESTDEGAAQVATVAVGEGEYFRYNDVLYIATTNIAIGDTIVPNTNCRATNVGSELEAQAADIAEVKSDLASFKKHEWGSGVDLTAYSENNKFTAPADGYLRMYASNSQATNYAIVNINGFLDEIYTTNTGLPQGSVVFVKAGMLLYGQATTDSSARYYPLV